MKNIIKQSLLLVVFLILWYALAFAASYLIYPPYPETIYTRASDYTIFQDPYRHMVLGIPRVALTPAEKIFFIGSSNVREGFPPDDLKLFFPGKEIHNLGMGASNITQTIEQVEFIMNTVPEKVIEDSIFVLGIFYGVFVDNDKRWEGDITTFAKAAVGSRLYRINKEKVMPVMNPRYLPYITKLVRPFLAFPISHKSDVFKKNTVMFVHNLLRNRKVDFSVYRTEESETVITEDYKQTALEFWRNYIGTEDGSLKDEQFREFLRLCRIIKDAGAVLVVVDMPLPEWHSLRSPYYSDYQKKQYYFKRAEEHYDVLYFNMQGSMQDSSFCDSVHPKPEMRSKWSELFKDWFYAQYKQEVVI